MKDLVWDPSAAGLNRFGVAHSAGWRLLACLPPPRPGQSNYLIPVRLLESQTYTWGTQADDVFAKLELQTESLGRKIAAVDRLRLSEFFFEDHFAAGRIAVWVPPQTLREGVWDFVRTALFQLQERVSLRLVTQIDYDQKRLHAALGSLLENIDFAVRHDPSAAATTAAFELVLSEGGVESAEAAVSVTGVGDLGSRIVKQLLGVGIGRIYIRDQNEERCRQAAGFSETIRVVTEEEMRDLRCHAHIFSADHSFTDELAAAFAKRKEVVAVGGPEAGLDAFVDARKVLTDAGKEFIPSILCGSMGLVCNLEETLGVTPHLDTMTARFRSLIEWLLEERRRREVTFLTACEDLLAGRAHPTATAPKTVGRSTEGTQRL